MRHVLLAALLVLLQGCATVPYTWSKPETDETQTFADMQDCRYLAADEAWRLGWERSWPPSFYDPHFMPPFYAWSRPFWYDFPSSAEREQSLFQFCMHSKGYRLEREYQID